MRYRVRLSEINSKIMIIELIFNGGVGTTVNRSHPAHADNTNIYRFHLASTCLLKDVGRCWRGDTV